MFIQVTSLGRGLTSVTRYKSGTLYEIGEMIFEKGYRISKKS